MSENGRLTQDYHGIPVADPDFELRWGPALFFLQSFLLFSLKISGRGGGGAPPGPLPYIRHCIHCLVKLTVNEGFLAVY